ncbi:MAG: hypothetical protein EHM53_01890 [Methanoregulaceae archaeon]|nr:MAG: hypothetical protein EHM53_01890 [Methanoregulaceae archaeon]
MFTGRRESPLLFYAVRHLIDSLGPVTAEATKTQVSFGTVRKFAWVWLPQLWITTKSDSSITVTFVL